MQAVLANFEGIMKQAHAKEAASLPRQHTAVDIDPGQSTVQALMEHQLCCTDTCAFDVLHLL